MNTNRNESRRVILHICVTDLPGSPQNRHNFLGELFCQQVLKRNFNNKLQTSNYDYMHLPPNFDTDKPVLRWFVCDLNVNCRLDRNELLSLPHRVYFVSRQKDEWYVSPYQYVPTKLTSNFARLFIPKDQYIECAKEYCGTYYWGGRQEQDMVDQMRELQRLPIETSQAI